MQIRRSSERGYADHGWLRSFHSFSFADYYDPKQMGFRALRVINEDRVQPGQGFGTHGHRDSMGTGSIIRPGDVQRMSAGRGVTHSEFNASDRELVHFLQIWILPEARGLTPGYEQKSFSEAERSGRLRLIASRDGREDSVRVHQDVSLYASLLEAGQRVRYQPGAGRNTYLQIARGSVTVNGSALAAGDAAASVDPEALEITGEAPAELLLFDLG